MEGNGLRWRGAMAGQGSVLELSQVEALEGSDRWWRGAVSGGGERSQVEGSDL